MMRLLALCIVMAVMLQLPNAGEAECCRRHSFQVRATDGQWHHGKLCGDCSTGTPYCSYQGCNLFGCSCDGGCRRGPCDGAMFEHQMRSVDSMRSENAHDVIRSADVDGDEMMSLEEAHAHLENSGIPTNLVKRSMKHFDTNYDNFLSAQEIDSGTK